MIDDIKELISKGFHELFIRAKQSTIKSILFVIFFFVFIPKIIQLLQYLFFIYIPYLYIFNKIELFLTSNIEIKDIIFLIVICICFYYVFNLKNQMSKTRKIVDNFDSHDLNKWNIPKDAVWTIEKPINEPWNMLSISNSSYPGTLKDAYVWYDYQVDTYIKIQKGQEFGIAVRSENNLNCVLISINERSFKINLIYQGTYILDEENSSFLPTTIKEDVWVKCKVILKGNLIEMWISDYKIFSYKIPTVIYKVENKYLGTKTTLRKIEESNKKVIDEETEDNKLYSEYISKPEGIEKDAAKSAWIKHIPSPNTKVVLEYQNGSVGLSASDGQEKQAFFRNFEINKI